MVIRLAIRISTRYTGLYLLLRIRDGSLLDGFYATKYSISTRAETMRKCKATSTGYQIHMTTVIFKDMLARDLNKRPQEEIEQTTRILKDYRRTHRTHKKRVSLIPRHLNEYMVLLPSPCHDMEDKGTRWSQYKFGGRLQQAHTIKAGCNQSLRKSEQIHLSIDKMEVLLSSPDTKSAKSKKIMDKKAYRRAVNYCSSFS